jgi:hypothetical protein
VKLLIQIYMLHSATFMGSQLKYLSSVLLSFYKYGYKHERSTGFLQPKHNHQPANKNKWIEHAGMEKSSHTTAVGMEKSSQEKSLRDQAEAGTGWTAAAAALWARVAVFYLDSTIHAPFGSAKRDFWKHCGNPVAVIVTCISPV